MCAQKHTYGPRKVNSSIGLWQDCVSAGLFALDSDFTGIVQCEYQHRKSWHHLLYFPDGCQSVHFRHEDIYHRKVWTIFLGFPHRIKSVFGFSTDLDVSIQLQCHADLPTYQLTIVRDQDTFRH